MSSTIPNTYQKVFFLGKALGSQKETVASQQAEIIELPASLEEQVQTSQQNLEMMQKDALENTHEFAKQEANIRVLEEEALEQISNMDSLESNINQLTLSVKN